MLLAFRLALFLQLLKVLSCRDFLSVHVLELGLPSENLLLFLEPKLFCPLRHRSLFAF